MGRNRKIFTPPPRPQPLSIGYGPLAVGRWPALLVPILMIYLMPLVHSKKYSKKRRVPVPVANEGGQVCTKDRTQYSGKKYNPSGENSTGQLCHFSVRQWSGRKHHGPTRWGAKSIYEKFTKISHRKCLVTLHLYWKVFSSPVVLKGIGKTQKTQVFINPFKCGIQFILSLFRLPKRENLD